MMSLSWMKFSTRLGAKDLTINGWFFNRCQFHIPDQYTAPIPKNLGSTPSKLLELPDSPPLYMLQRVKGGVLALQSKPFSISAAPLLTLTGNMQLDILFPSQEGLAPEQCRCFVNGPHTFFMRIERANDLVVPPPAFGLVAPMILGIVNDRGKSRLTIDRPVTVKTSIQPWADANSTLAVQIANKALETSGLKAAATDSASLSSLLRTAVEKGPSSLKPVLVQNLVMDLVPSTKPTTFHARLQIFCHPHISELIEMVKRDGLAALFTDEAQDLTVDFASLYRPDTGRVQMPYPNMGIDFSAEGPFADVNRELWEYLWMLFSDRFEEEGNLDVCQQMLYYLCDWRTPGNINDAKRIWKVKVLRDATPLRVDEMLKTLRPGESATAEQEEVIALLNDMIKYPFEPFRIAERRPVFLKQAILYKHADVIIRRSDEQFRMLQLPAAFQGYSTLASIFGERPQKVPALRTPAPQTFAQLRSKLDAAGNALVEAETEWPVLGTLTSIETTGSVSSLVGTALTSYFCLPANTKLAEYHDLIEDRLFKLRNGLDIDGNPRPQALYDALRDPSQLLDMARAGLDSGSMASALRTRVPRLRFPSAHQKALEMCEAYVSLEQLHLSACEKVDEVTYSLRRAEYETALQRMAKGALDLRITAQETRLSAMRVARDQLKMQLSYFSERLGESIESFVEAPDMYAESIIEVQRQVASGKQAKRLNVKGVGEVGLDLPETGIGMVDTIARIVVALIGTDNAQGVTMLEGEKEEMKQAFLAAVYSQGAAALDALSSPMHILPNISVCAQPMGCGVNVSMGGSNIAASIGALAGVLRAFSSAHTHRSNRAGKLASFIWRERDHIFNRDAKIIELEQHDHQIAVEQHTLQSLKQEKSNFEAQIRRLEGFEALMRDRTMNLPFATLRAKMLERLADELWDKHVVYWANLAQQALRFYLGTPEVTYIIPGARNKNKKGFLDGPQLKLQLLNMHRVWTERPQEYPLITKISLRQLDPAALITLQQTGKCTFSIPEFLYDISSPGHYFRKIERVSMTLPCVMGPHATINGMLIIKTHRYREKPTLDDNALVSDIIPVQSIMVNHGQDDTGEYEFSPKDELRPFEGAGAVATFEFILPDPIKGFPPFDYRTCYDLFLKIETRSKYDGAYKVAVMNQTGKVLKEMNEQAPFGRLFSFHHEYSSEWARFSTNGENASFALPKSHYPYMFQGKKLLAVGVELYCKLKDGASALETASVTMLTPNGPVSLKKGRNLPALHVFTGTLDSIEISHDVTKAGWSIDLQPDDRKKLDNISMIISYTIG